MGLCFKDKGNAIFEKKKKLLRRNGKKGVGGGRGVTGEREGQIERKRAKKRGLG